MTVDLLSAYLPMDRRHALATGHDLPDQAAGATLLADITGFTPLTDALVTILGPRRGAEELIHLLNLLYDAIIAPVHAHGGSVVGFSGDGFVAWFDTDPGLRAVACGLAMQQAMSSLSLVQTSSGEPVSFSLKVAVTTGPVRRFLVGDPRVDLLAGAVLDRLVQVEQATGPGQVVVGPAVVRELGDRLIPAGRYGEMMAVVRLAAEVTPTPWPAPAPSALTAEQVRPYLLPPVYEQVLAGQGEFLAELRPAVALFLRFGGLDYDRDDEAAARLDAYVRWVQEILEHYEGTLLQLTTGDKGSYLYASFGALTAHEDDAGRAVAAALELQQTPPDLAFITGVQIGVSQGRVRAGAYGSPARRTYGAQGDAVNVAARLMAAAPAGEIRCSPAIHQATRERWAFEALPAVRLKGKPDPLPVYRPLRQARGREVRVAGALIGRRAEVETLARLLDEVQPGQRHILLLEGEAGIGKSRLVSELARLAREQGVTWLEGAGQSIEPQTPYRAWRDLLAAYLGLDEEMALADRQRRVRERIAAAGPALTERAPLLNDILRLNLPETDLTRGFDAKLRHESLTALVIDLLRAAARTGPLVMVLEDAHWLDSLSWELALAVARALLDQPLLLVMVLRPLPVDEPARAEYTALASMESAKTLRLAALPGDETVALAAARLGVIAAALPGEVADLVRERAGGNPFFAEELAHVLRDSGVVVVEDEVCTLAGDLTTLHERVPDTVEGVVLARIDRLPPEEQLTLKVAAVIGRSFLYRALHDVHPQQVAEAPLRAHLDDLTRRDLTLLEALAPEPAYLFKHVITQQVAYDTLLFAQRQALHRAVAGWYEQSYAGNLSPHYPLLVHHWHRTEDEERERHYAKLAGEQAAAQYANAEAVTYLSRALSLTPETDHAERYALLLVREKALDLQGAREAQTQDLEALEALAEALGDERRQAKVVLRRAQYADVIGDRSTVIAAAQAAIHVARASQTVDLEAEGYLLWGRTLWHQGEFEAAHSRLEQALSLARAAGARQVEVDSLRNSGVVHFHQDNYAEAEIYYEQALRIHREIGDHHGAGWALNNLGATSYLQGDYPGARAYYEEALRVFRQIGDRDGEGTVFNNLGTVYKYQGDYDSARASLGQALHIVREIDDRPGEAQALDTLGLVSICQGNHAQAQSYLQQALHIGRELGNRMEISVILHRLGHAFAGQGNYARAQACVEEALRIAREIDYRFGKGHALTVLGHISLHFGDYAEARTCYEEALRTFREIGDRRDESLELVYLGLLSHQLGDNEAAQEYSQRALLIARDLGARDIQGYALTHLGHALVSLGHPSAGFAKHPGASAEWAGQTLDEATDAYEQALALRREMGQPHLAMETLAGLARVALAQGNISQAQAQIEEILDYLETNSLGGAEDPFRVYLACYQVLDANQDPRALEILTTAYNLLQEQVIRIDDEDLRRSFLENVTANRDLVAAYRAMNAKHGREE